MGMSCINSRLMYMKSCENFEMEIAMNYLGNVEIETASNSFIDGKTSCVIKNLNKEYYYSL